PPEGLRLGLGSASSCCSLSAIACVDMDLRFFFDRRGEVASITSRASSASLSSVLPSGRTRTFAL
ncbi:MAG: hypothetical protein Q9187_001426, partial [Circinaria calcarea]